VIHCQYSRSAGGRSRVFPWKPRIRGYQACRNPGCDGWVLELLIKNGQTTTGKIAPQHPRSPWTKPSRQLLLLQQQPWGMRQNAALKSALLCSALSLHGPCAKAARSTAVDVLLHGIESNSNDGPKSSASDQLDSGKPFGRRIGEIAGRV
jgi:hypothetical protein